MQRLLLLLIFTLSFTPNVLYSEDKTETAPVSLYKSNYIIFDRNRDAKFQLSYRIRMLHFKESFNLFVSHTHKAFWAITTEKSAPFKEHNFNPEIHLRWDNPQWAFAPEHTQIGFEHESTGVAGPFSRSWNRITGQVEWTFFSKNHSLQGHLHTYVRAWRVVDKDKDNNPDIAEQIGPGEVSFSYTLHERWKGGDQAVATMTMRFHSFMFEYGFKAPFQDFFWFIQYWKGRSEWLVDYKQDTTVLRVGIKFFVKQSRGVGSEA